LNGRRALWRTEREKGGGTRDTPEAAHAPLTGSINQVFHDGGYPSRARRGPQQCALTTCALHRHWSSGTPGGGLGKSSSSERSRRFANHGGGLKGVGRSCAGAGSCAGPRASGPAPNGTRGEEGPRSDPANWHASRRASGAASTLVCRPDRPTGVLRSVARSHHCATRRARQEEEEEEEGKEDEGEDQCKVIGRPLSQGSSESSTYPLRST